VEKFQRIRIAGESALALGPVTRFVTILRRFHPANGDIKTGDAVPPAAEPLA
jgi:hypothetical protein